MREGIHMEETSGQYDFGSAVLFATSVPVAAVAEDANTQNRLCIRRKERLRVRMRGRNPALTIKEKWRNVCGRLHGSV